MPLPLLRAFIVAATATLATAADLLVPGLPCVQVSRRDSDQLASGGIVSRTLRLREGHVGVFAMARTTADVERFLSNARAISELRKSSFVIGVREFSNPPTLSDLDGLTLTDRDRANVAECQLRRCSFKLTAHEIRTLITLRDAGGSGRDDVARALNGALLERAGLYLGHGLAALPPIENRSKPWHLDDTLQQLHTESGCFPSESRIPSWLVGDPGRAHDGESFLYWSQEYYGAGRPVILLTHVAIVRLSATDAIVVGKQVFASRYVDGAITIMALTTDPVTDARYLTYLNLSSVDLLGGVFGSLKRDVLESRLSRELPEVIAKLRSRLERTTW